MEAVQLRIPRSILEDARALASLRGSNRSRILRQALKLGLYELRADGEPKEESKNDRARS